MIVFTGKSQSFQGRTTGKQYNKIPWRRVNNRGWKTFPQWINEKQLVEVEKSKSSPGSHERVHRNSLGIASSVYMYWKLVIGTGHEKVPIRSAPTLTDLMEDCWVRGPLPWIQGFRGPVFHAWDVNSWQGWGIQLCPPEGVRSLSECLRAPGAPLMVQISNYCGIVGLDPERMTPETNVTKLVNGSQFKKVYL